MKAGSNKLNFLILFLIICGFFHQLPSAQGAEYPLITNEIQAGAMNETAGLSLPGNFPPARRWRAVSLTPHIATTDGLSPGDTLTLNLFDDKVYTARIDRVSVNINGTVTVRGHIDGFRLGYVLISTTRGCSLGNIRIPEKGEYYVIRSEANNKIHYLIDVNVDQLEKPPRDGPTPIPPLHARKEAAKMKMVTAAPAIGTQQEVTIDVMIVYTPAAFSRVGSEPNMNMANFIANTIGYANIVLDNSDTDLTMNLVYSAEVDYTESGSTYTDLDRLTYTNDGYMDEVHTWRDQYSADLVVLLTDVNDYGGLGWPLFFPSGYPQLGFSITSVRFDIGYDYESSSHEVGHNMGCDHCLYQNEDPGGNGVFSYSNGWRWIGNDNGKYCDVMTYEEDGYDVVPYFSNPNIWFEGARTGNAILGDNARTIRETKQAVASYRAYNMYTLSIDMMGEGSVRVNGILRSLPWFETFMPGTNVTLEAVPDSGWMFFYWSGGISGSNNTTSIQMYGSKNVTANFAKYSPFYIVFSDNFDRVMDNDYYRINYQGWYEDTVHPASAPLGGQGGPWVIGDWDGYQSQPNADGETLTILASNYVDTFNTNQGMLWQEEVPHAWNPDFTQNILNGVLRFVSTGGGFFNQANTGPFLYKNVTGSFQATVQVVGGDYWWQNLGGLMARAANPSGAGANESWVAVEYFPMYSVGNQAASTTNGATVYSGVAGYPNQSSGGEPYLKLTGAYADGTWTFIMESSLDGQTYDVLNTIVRTDLPEELQVGIMQGNFTTDYLATMEFDNFLLLHFESGYMKNIDIQQSKSSYKPTEWGDAGLWSATSPGEAIAPYAAIAENSYLIGISNGEQATLPFFDNFDAMMDVDWNRINYQGWYEDMFLPASAPLGGQGGPWVIGGWDGYQSLSNADGETLTVLASNYVDTFNTNQDMLWQEEVPHAWNPSFGQNILNGVLRFVSTGAGFENQMNTGPFLYKNVTCSFEATVQVVGGDYWWHNLGGLMARAANPSGAGANENWVAVEYFPMYAIGNQAASTTNGTTVYSGVKGYPTPSSGGEPYLRLRGIAGNNWSWTFYFETSPDGINWTSLPGLEAGITRTDLPAELQVGIMQGNFTTDWLCTMKFDNFSLDFIADLNGDGIVNFKDFALLANEWLQTGPWLIGDINKDNIVDVKDLAIMAYYWLK